MLENSFPGGKVMKRTVMVAMLVVLVLFFANPLMIQAARERRPEIVVAPVIIVGCEHPQVAQATISKTYEAFERMGFRVIAGMEVEKAMRKLGYPIYGQGLLHQPINTLPAVPGQPLVTTGPPAGVTVPTYVVLDPEVLSRLGKYFKADMAAGVVFPKLYSKYTTHFPTGRRLNGRSQLNLRVVDVKQKQILYESFSPPGEEYGVTDRSQEDTRIAVSVLGGLLAGGVIGKGRTTRTIGWAALAAPHFVGGGNRENIEFESAVLAINSVLGDFYQRYTLERGYAR